MVEISVTAKMKLKGVRRVEKHFKRLQKIADKTSKAIERFNEAYKNIPTLEQITINLEVKNDKQRKTKVPRPTKMARK